MPSKNIRSMEKIKRTMKMRRAPSLRRKKITKSSGNEGNFKGGASQGPPRLLTKGEQKFFGIEKKVERREKIERRVRGKKEGSALSAFEKKTAAGI